MIVDALEDRACQCEAVVTGEMCPRCGALAAVEAALAGKEGA